MVYTRECLYEAFDFVVDFFGRPGFLFCRLLVFCRLGRRFDYSFGLFLWRLLRRIFLLRSTLSLWVLFLLKLAIIGCL